MSRSRVGRAWLAGDHPTATMLHPARVETATRVRVAHQQRTAIVGLHKPAIDSGSHSCGSTRQQPDLARRAAVPAITRRARHRHQPGAAVHLEPAHVGAGGKASSDCTRARRSTRCPAARPRRRSGSGRARGCRNRSCGRERPHRRTRPGRSRRRRGTRRRRRWRPRRKRALSKRASLRKIAAEKFAGALKVQPVNQARPWNAAPRNVSGALKVAPEKSRWGSAAPSSSSGSSMVRPRRSSTSPRRSGCASFARTRHSRAARRAGRRSGEGLRERTDRDHVDLDQLRTGCQQRAIERVARSPRCRPRAGGAGRTPRPGA